MGDQEFLRSVSAWLDELEPGKRGADLDEFDDVEEELLALIPAPRVSAENLPW
ncbi:carboxypeptidase M32 [Amycolatopsis suaedae]|uniref:carboxypeptidase M32 n=1 Tax=Amycolatopsis suaedae TaxID=2510978 RepID=UPI0013EEF78B|nr:carboxypeptidase M32 [Amycolatopsis suaedae]